MSAASQRFGFRLPKGMAQVNAVFGGWSALVLVFFYAPILFLIVFSFNSSKLNVVWEGFTLRWYRELWSDSRLIAGLQNSLIVAAWATLLAVIVGTTAA